MGCALATHPGLFSATSESSIVPGCSPFRMGADSYERCSTLLHTSRPHYDMISLFHSPKGYKAHEEIYIWHVGQCSDKDTHMRHVFIHTCIHASKRRRCIKNIK